MKRSKVYQIGDEEFVELIDSSTSYSEVLRKIGLGTVGGASIKPLKARIEELNLDVSHFSKGSNGGGKVRYDNIEDVLIENSPYKNGSSLKARLIREKILSYLCEECGIKEWNQKPISLQLDHKNGVNNDNRVENLRLLCPNCHSQTNNYAGKNKFKEA
jgi:Zn finger protein HypA/HybF involved in hydrogenase expression